MTKRNLKVRGMHSAVADSVSARALCSSEHKRKATVAFVAERGLCTGCGTCSGVCPTRAIEMQVSDRESIYLPQIDEEKCVECGLCVKCCPGYVVDSRKLAFQKSTPLRDSMIGGYLDCYVGHSNDNGIRLGASSGGLVTQLLIYALEKGVIDGALVARMSRDHPLKPELIIARTKEEIIDAAKSKYCPVPLNAKLRELIAQDGKFAVVGLPCHIHGIRLAEKYVKGLKGKIVLHVGLFCGHTVDFAGTELLLRKLGIPEENVANLSYRGGGWPGIMSVSLKDGGNSKMRFDRGWNAYWNVFSPFFFTPMRCMKCPDQSNEFCDISFGDAWLKEFGRTEVGMSVAITRTQAAEKLLRELVTNGFVSVKRITSGEVKRSQAFSLNFKKETLSARLSFFKKVGENVPEIYPELSSTYMGAAFAVLPYLSRKMSSSKRSRDFLRCVPTPIYRLYFGLFKSLFFVSTRYRVW